MEDNVKIYIPIRKPAKPEHEIKNGATAGYPVQNPKDKKS